MSAWIETYPIVEEGLTEASHSSWVRGLKQRVWCEILSKCRSHSSWVRGLKLAIILSQHFRTIVALFVSAWIETPTCGWIPAAFSMSHSSWVRGLKHVSLYRWIRWTWRRTLRECVDWNTNVRILSKLFFVALFVSAWIETILPLIIISKRWSHSSWVRGLKLKSKEILPWIY